MDDWYSSAINPDFVDEELTSLRLRLLRNGYRPVPISGPTMRIRSAGKRPLMDNWQAVCAIADEPEVIRWTRGEPNCTNTGLLCGRLIGIDVDVLAPELVNQLVDVTRTMLGRTSLERVGKSPKTLLCYQTEAPFRKIMTPRLVLPDNCEAQVEVLAEGQQFVGFGVHPDTGRSYQWLHGVPDTVPLATLPVVTETQVRAFMVTAEAILRAAGGRTKAEIDGKTTKSAKVAEVSKSGAKVIDFEKAVGESSFFKEVNRLACGAIEKWFPLLFPTAWQEPGTGAWRVSSKDLGRPLEEDLSMHPTEGGRDFGTEKSVSPINVVIEHSGSTGAFQAALWLCDRLHVNPADLGWKEKSRKNRPKKTDDNVDNLDQDTDWYSRCLTGAEDRPLSNLANALLALREDPAWSGILAYDGMLRASMLMRPVPIHGVAQELGNSNHVPFGMRMSVRLRNGFRSLDCPRLVRTPHTKRWTFVPLSAATIRSEIT